MHQLASIQTNCLKASHIYIPNLYLVKFSNNQKVPFIVLISKKKSPNIYLYWTNLPKTTVISLFSFCYINAFVCIYICAANVHRSDRRSIAALIFKKKVINIEHVAWIL